ncbi:UDP-N-acetylmuramoyl-tripeptide--D-alanyl-D-alanine ligase [Bifidobacterium leontopitheci]|nr:UDP-N-acetylmuramoyl-tripeptide--D-alanyl-D-alanine ligase [Bifidobacterium leontopitheci]
MMPMTLGQVADAVAGELVLPAAGETGGSGPEPIARSVVSDSRQVRPGSVFVAIAGERVDGHDFVAKAAQDGAIAALVQHRVDAPVAQIVVPDTVEALGALAKANIAMRRASGKPFTLIGITGSVGKTTTKDLLASLLAHLGPTVAPVGSFNNEIGLPLTALKVGQDTRFFVAEMGANHLGEIARLTVIAPPDIALVLKVGCAHLGEFGSVERIAQAKSEIVRGLVPGGLAVLNAEDGHVSAMEGIVGGDHAAWFARRDEPVSQEAEGFITDAADPLHGVMHAADITIDDDDHPSFTLIAPDGRTAPVRLAIPGAHNVMNALAAASVARIVGMDLADIAGALGEKTSISPHRMAVSRIDLGTGAFTLIDDSFNANPDSMRAGLDGLGRWHAGKPVYRVAVLGAMLELGGDEKSLHEQVGAYAAGKADAVIAVGNGESHVDSLADALAQGARSQLAATGGDEGSVHLVHDIDQANDLVGRLAGDHDAMAVLLKGSHVSGLSALATRWADHAAEQAR